MEMAVEKLNRFSRDRSRTSSPIKAMVTVMVSGTLLRGGGGGVLPSTLYAASRRRH